MIVVAGAAAGIRLSGDEPGETLALKLQSNSSSGPPATIAQSLARGYEGETSLLATSPPDSAETSKYARGAADGLRWGAGTDIWYGAAFYLPEGFYDAQQGQIDLLRWDNFSVDQQHTDRGGVVVYGGDRAGSAYLIRAQIGGDQDELVGPFRLAEGSWHWIEVHQRFSPENADDLSELYVNDKLVGRTRAPNWYERPATALRFGLVAVSGGRARPVRLWFDRPSLARSRRGPLE